MAIDSFYRGYVKCSGKKAIERFKGVDIRTVPPEGDYAGVLDHDTVLIDIDTKGEFKTLLEILGDSYNYRAYASDHGGHVLFKNNDRHAITKAMTHINLACGLVADIKVGLKADGTDNNCLEFLKVNGKDRKIVHDSGVPYEEVPFFLLPLNRSKDKTVTFSNMIEGDGRNDAIYKFTGSIKTCLGLSTDEITQSVRILNSFVLGESLSDNELGLLLRKDRMDELKEPGVTADDFDDDGDPEPQKVKSNDSKTLETLSAKDLISENLPPIHYIVDTILPTGLTILAAPPKYGKSFFCLQMLLAVTSGEDFLDFKTHKCNALYLDLEDSDQRLQSRTKAILDGREAPQGLYRVLRAPTIKHGLLDALQAEIDRDPDIGLIVIDTLGRIRDGARKNESAYDTDMRETGELFRLATDNDIAIVLVHHTRKNIDPSDPYSNIGGTQGLTGSCDTMIVLSKEKRTDEFTQLWVTGRSVENNVFSIYRMGSLWERSSISWEEFKRKNEEDEVIHSNEAQTIRKLLDDSNPWTGSASDIITASKKFYTPINKSSRKLTAWLTKNDYILFSQFRISITPINHGTASKKYRLELIK